MRVINLFGAPGSGKSTLRAGLFYEMKMAGYNVEEVTEYAKDMVWEERFNIFNDQIYILGKQNRRLLRLTNKVDYVLTDSPIIMGIAYMVNTPYDATLRQLIAEVFKSYDNFNVFINRSHEYQNVGRNQTADESDILAEQIKELMKEFDIPFIEVNSSDLTPTKLLTLVENNTVGANTEALPAATKVLLDNKYGMRCPGMSWIDYTTIFNSLDELVEDVISCKCFIASITEDFGVTVVEIADNNMWSGGLVALGSYDEPSAREAIDKTWDVFAHK